MRETQRSCRKRNGRCRPLLNWYSSGWAPESQDLFSLFGGLDVAWLPSSPLISRVVVAEVGALPVHLDPWFSAERRSFRCCLCGDWTRLSRGLQRRADRRCRKIETARRDYRTFFSTTTASSVASMAARRSRALGGRPHTPDTPRVVWPRPRTFPPRWCSLEPPARLYRVHPNATRGVVSRCWIRDLAGVKADWPAKNRNWWPWRRLPWFLPPTPGGRWFKPCLRRLLLRPLPPKVLRSG